MISRLSTLHSVAVALRSHGCCAVSMAFVIGCGDGQQDGRGGQAGGSADACETAPVATDSAQPVGRVTNLAASSDNACAVFEDGSMRCWGENTYGQLGFGDLWSGGYAHITERLPPVDRVAIAARRRTGRDLRTPISGPA